MPAILDATLASVFFRRQICLIGGMLVCLALLGSSNNASAQTNDEAPDTIVICGGDLQIELDRWLEYRRSQGHKIAVLVPRTTFEENKKLIAEKASSGNLKNVVLVGDAGDQFVDHRKLVPTGYVAARVNIKFGSEPEIATDNPYADLDGDGTPELTVGRLPIDSAAELRTLIDRIIRYENQPVGQPWQRKINLIAGVGGFGVLVDKIMENTTKQILTDLIPASYRTSMTYGSWTSPYCPDPSKFSDTAIARFNEGCLFWVYCGHGHFNQLDRVMLPDQSHRILDTELVHKLDCRRGSPIAVCLSCYTGAYDGQDDCLAEHMLRQQNGPVAVVCGSRVTMPYAMSVLSVEMMNEYFSGDCETIGQLILTAKRRMMSLSQCSVERENQDENKLDSDAAENHQYRQLLDSLGQALSPTAELLDAECQEHVHLMQLLGDPLLRLKRPQKLALELEPAENAHLQFVAGDEVTVRGNSPASGVLQLEICYQRDRFRHRPSYRREYDSSEAAFSKIHDDYLQAHDLVCTRKTVRVEPGPFELAIEVPVGASGRCDVRAMLLGVDGIALDSQPIKIKSAGRSRGTTLK